MKNVVAYCRSASEVQGDYSNVKRQAKAIRRYARNRGVRITKIYMDPAQSGISLNRPALKALLAECRAGNIGTVIIRSLDRIARDNTLIEKVLRKFNENGVRVEFSTEHGKADFRFMRAAAGALAEFEKTRV